MKKNLMSLEAMGTEFQLWQKAWGLKKKTFDLVSKYNYFKINEWINKSWTTEGG